MARLGEVDPFWFIVALCVCLVGGLAVIWMGWI